jgi:hypothetical protein
MRALDRRFISPIAGTTSSLDRCPFMAKEPIQPPTPSPVEPSKPPAEEPGKPYPVENPPAPAPNEDRPLVDPVPPDKDLPRM